jgi:hypothetical protein
VRVKEAHVDPNGEECAWCFDPAIETAVVRVRGDQREIDLCDRHLREVLTGARPISGTSRTRIERPGRER